MKRFTAIIFLMMPLFSHAFCNVPMYGNNQQLNQLAQNQYDQCQQNEQRIQQQEFQQRMQQIQQQNQQSMQNTLQQLQNPSYRQQQFQTGIRQLGQ